MKTSTILAVSLLAVGLAAWTCPARADSIAASCEVRKDGDKQKGKSGPCTVSQRQGFVEIDLKNGDTISLSPGNSAGHLKDQHGKKVTRTSTGNGMSLHWEGGRHVIVTWEGNSYGGSTHNNNGYKEHSGNGDYRLNQLGNGQYEVVWSRPFCSVMIGRDGGIKQATEDCTDQQVNRAREVGRRGY